MALQVGSRLGHYDVTALIGEGGMGQVYQATDTKLNRQVALKILPEAFASDPDRLARFQREAQVLASLNHPGIAAIYGLEESDDTRALVLELVEGPTLADRIAQGPIALDEALPIAKQIAEALEAAHEAGVIHRDLKPANIKVREDGTVKVLDFGLAKALDTAPEGDPSLSPTLTAAATQMGVIMGTAAYMSPEQARGKTVDKRADVWAFGVVLLEMLTGRTVFEGEDVSMTLSSVLQREPDWSHLPSAVSPSLSVFLHRCLEKDPKQRVHDVADVRLAMEGAFETAVSVPSATAPQPAGWRQAMPWMLATLVVSSIVAGLVVRSLRPPVTAQVSRFAIPAPSLYAVGVSLPLALSPDGRTLVFATLQDGTRQLYQRPMDQLEAVPIRGTESGAMPFLSPDGEWVGFYSRSEQLLKRVSLAGGPSTTLTPIPWADYRLASWGPDGTIVFAREGEHAGLWSVADTGGVPQEISPVEGEKGSSYYDPQFLPDGSAVLFTIVSSVGEQQVAVRSLETGEQRVLLEGTSARLTTTGHLLFTRADSLWAVPFDVGRLDVAGEPSPVLEGIQTNALGIGRFAIGDDGSLAYVPAGTSFTQTLEWVDRQGTRLPPTSAEPLPTGDYTQVRLSPSGRRGALQIGFEPDADIALMEFATGIPTQFAFDDGPEIDPVWSPDESQIAYGAGDQIRVKRLVVEAHTVLFESPGQQVFTEDWSMDGMWLIYRVENQVYALSMAGDGESVLLNDTPSEKEEFRFSPDGHWISYNSDESGRMEVYVVQFPSWTGKQRVSSNGGGVARWRRDSRELVYMDLQAQLYGVDVTIADGTIETGRPTPLFETSMLSASGYVGMDTYDISSDADRFVTIQAEGATERSIEIVLNWFEELTRLVPTN